MVEISDEILKALRPLMEEAGIDLDVQGAEKADRPVGITVNLGQPLHMLAQEMGSILASRGLYRFRDIYVTVNESDPKDRMPEMEPERFISWVQRFFETQRWNQKSEKWIEADMTRQLAVNVMKADNFKDQIPKIKVVLPSCLPVYGDDGSPKLLGHGYNAREEIYVLKSAPKLDEEMSLNHAMTRWGEIYGHFPWGDDGRSMAVHAACSVGMFCQYLFPDGCAVPLFQYTANQEGAGKSLLCRSVLIPIYTLDGVGSTDYSDTDKFKDELNSIARSGKGYVFFDDVAGSLFSTTLNRWVTDTTWEFRKFHSQTQIRVDKRCMTLISDNGCTLSDDLIRRALIVSLQMDERASERDAKLKWHMDEYWLNDDANRAELMSILWAFVRHWADEGMKPARRSVPSFRKWAQTVGGIVSAAGFSDPFAPAGLLEGGDKRRTEMDKLMQLIVEGYSAELPVQLPLAELCAIARENGLFDYPLEDLALVRNMMDAKPSHYYDYQELASLTEADRNHQAARWMNPQKQASPFSKRLKKQLNRRFTVNGKHYRLTKRDARTATYEVAVIEGE
ncbi:MAG: hypothetical protein ACPG32_04535 [Akkermansiaceae bacterium]